MRGCDRVGLDGVELVDLQAFAAGVEADPLASPLDPPARLLVAADANDGGRLAADDPIQVELED
jgi:hypothetical protein